MPEIVIEAASTWPPCTAASAIFSASCELDTTSIPASFRPTLSWTPDLELCGEDRLSGLDGALAARAGPQRNAYSVPMATNPVDPIEEEIRGILDAHPELQSHFDQVERQLADGTLTGVSHEEVARKYGLGAELDDEAGR